MNQKNSYYQGIVQNLYAGSKGCFLCFAQFFYQYSRCAALYPQFQGIFRKIYENELKNCKILSKILIKLGGENKFYSATCKYFSAASINYALQPSEMFLADIELLQLSVLDFAAAINTIEDRTIKENLKQILSAKKECLKFLKESLFRSNMIGGTDANVGKK